jgi:peptidoglycan-associated lipoprotein
MKSYRWLIVSLAAVVLAACAHTEVKPEEAPPAKVEAPPAPEPEKSGDQSCTADTNCGPKQLCIRKKCTDISIGLAECRELRVHFAFNSWDIPNEDRTGLERIARCLRADQVIHVTIEGNADERGTEEYNLHLGDKRATAVEKFMEALGVSSSQLKTISYGKDHPLCSEHNEDCWAKNRRASVKPKSLATGK